MPVLRAKARFAWFQEVGLGSSATKRIVAALCLCVAGAVVSGLLLLQHHGETLAVSAVNEVCGNGQTSGCADVARSAWSSFAGVARGGVRAAVLPRAGPGAGRSRC